MQQVFVLHKTAKKTLATLLEVSFGCFVLVGAPTKKRNSFAAGKGFRLKKSGGFDCLAELA
jgi:hypothetical protein